RRGDFESYRAVCWDVLRWYAPEDMVAKEPALRIQRSATAAQASRWPMVAALVALLSTAAPEPGVDVKWSLELGRRAAAAETDEYRAYYLLARGAAEYRAGQFATAVEVLPQAIAQFQQPNEKLLLGWQGWPFIEAPCRAQAYLFLAMAH